MGKKFNNLLFSGEFAGIPGPRGFPGRKGAPGQAGFPGIDGAPGPVGEQVETTRENVLCSKNLN